MECWICLAGETAIRRGDFTSFCACDEEVRPVHARCLSRWQLQRAGTREETHCRFCNSQYDLDWRNSLAPSGNSDGSEYSAPRPPTPIMAIFFEGQVHRIKVYPGPEGKARFQQQIRQLVQLGDDEDFEVEFECKAPDSGAVLHLDGMEAFDAATHCAALTAAERVSKQQQQQQQHQQQQHQQPQQQPQQQPPAQRPRRRQQPPRAAAAAQRGTAVAAASAGGNNN